MSSYAVPDVYSKPRFHLRHGQLHFSMFPELQTYFSPALFNPGHNAEGYRFIWFIVTVARVWTPMPKPIVAINSCKKSGVYHKNRGLSDLSFSVINFALTSKSEPWRFLVRENVWMSILKDGIFCCVFRVERVLLHVLFYRMSVQFVIPGIASCYSRCTQ